MCFDVSVQHPLWVDVLYGHHYLHEPLQRRKSCQFKKLTAFDVGFLNCICFYHWGGEIEEQEPKDIYKTTHFIKTSSKFCIFYIILVINFKMNLFLILSHIDMNVQSNITWCSPLIVTYICGVFVFHPYFNQEKPFSLFHMKIWEAIWKFESVNFT